MAKTKTSNKKRFEKAIHLDDFKREYLENKDVAEMYLNEALAQNDMVFFRECLKEIIKIHGSVADLAKTLSVSRQLVSRSLTEKGGLKIDMIGTYLKYVDMRLKVGKAV